MNDSPPAATLFVANDLALDFINSAYGPNDQRIDVFSDDRAVVQWLASAGVLDRGAAHAPEGVAALAADLREEARLLLTAAQAGRPLRATLLNKVLEEGRPILRLESIPGGAAAALVERRRDDSAESLLEPIAAAIGRLLSGGDLENVRKCEAHDCTLLFHDTTKSRRRRWCSMALCGNRMKVAAFRSRRQAE